MEEKMTKKTVTFLKSSLLPPSFVRHYHLSCRYTVLDNTVKFIISLSFSTQDTTSLKCKEEKDKRRVEKDFHKISLFPESVLPPIHGDPKHDYPNLTMVGK